eukprot:m.208578 g.208578  ORF g.208578 m.208578 type:complete len:311 (+) comp10717_c2_seq1:1867-2799(+)
MLTRRPQARHPSPRMSSSILASQACSTPPCRFGPVTKSNFASLSTPIPAAAVQFKFARLQATANGIAARLMSSKATLGLFLIRLRTKRSSTSTQTQLKAGKCARGKTSSLVSTTTSRRKSTALVTSRSSQVARQILTPSSGEKSKRLLPSQSLAPESASSASRRAQMVPLASKASAVGALASLLLPQGQQRRLQQMLQARPASLQSLGSLTMRNILARHGRSGRCLPLLPPSHSALINGTDPRCNFSLAHSPTIAFCISCITFRDFVVVFFFFWFCSFSLFRALADLRFSSFLLTIFLLLFDIFATNTTP